MKTKHITEAVMHAVFFTCGMLAIAFVALISLYIITAGLPAIKEIGLGEFLLGAVWKSTAAEPSFGILPFILTSIWGTLGAIVIGVPVGVLTAVFLSKVASPRVAGIVRPAVDLLAGIPSVVYGLVGMMVLVPLMMQVFHLDNGTCLLAAMLVLAIMILPLILRTTEEALLSVPDSYREGSFGLGAGRLGTVTRIVLPPAMSGILAGVILAIGRVVGETAALIYTAGTVADWPKGVMSSGRTLAVHMYVLSGEGLHVPEASATAVVLLVIVVGMNALSSYVAKKLTRG